MSIIKSSPIFPIRSTNLPFRRFICSKKIFAGDIRTYSTKSKPSIAFNSYKLPITKEGFILSNSNSYSLRSKKTSNIPAFFAVKISSSAFPMKSDSCSIICFERVTGIEPVSQPWEGRIIPIYYTRDC